MQATGEQTASDRLSPAALHYAAIANAASQYLVAMPEDETGVLGLPVAAIWHGKRATRSGGLELVERGELQDWLENEQTNPLAWVVTAIHACFGDLAVVRADAWGSGATSFLLLFREHGDWKIAGDTRVDAESGQRDTRFTSRETESEVLAVLQEYYRAVTRSDEAAIRRIFAPCWHMKNHEGDMLASEETDAFVKRLDEPFPTYWDDRQVADVQIAANRIAYVRVDRPSTPSTTVFLLARSRNGWKVIDKAFTDGKRKCRTLEKGRDYRPIRSDDLQKV